MNIGLGGNIVKSHKQWMGKWYKPWTWTLFTNRYVFEIIDDFRFIECSWVSHPIDPLCKIRDITTEGN